MIIFYALVMLLSGTVFSMEKKIVLHKSPPKSKVETRQDCMLFAIADDDLQEVKLCWAKGCSVNKRTTYIVRGSDQTFSGMTPLMVAAFHGRGSIADFCVRHNAKLDLQNKFGDTALIIAARLGRADIVKRLIDAEANIYIKNKMEENALQAANNSFLRWNMIDPEIHAAFNYIVTLLSPGQPKLIFY